MRGLFGAISDRLRPQAATSLDLLREYFVKPSKSGQNVTAETALQVTTVFACVNKIANGVAQAPLKLHEELPGGRGSKIARNHPLFNVLYRRPNPWQTSFQFRQTMVFHRALTGRFFAFKNRVRGQIVELLPFEPGKVQVKRNDDYSLTYRVTADNGAKQDFPQEAIWDVRGPSWNSWLALEPVKLAREAIGLGMATEEAHARLHRNGARTGGLYSVEGILKDTQYPMLREWIEKNHTGENAFKPMILDRAAKFTQTGMTGVDAQHIETRKFQVEEICRAFGVMPIMVGLSDKTATYASAEQMFLAHVVHTLAPWYEDLEQSIDVNLLDGPRDKGVFAKFNANALMRGAAKDQSEYFAKALGAGGSPAWMTQNEVRELIELNPLDGGDELPKPTNVAPQPTKEPSQ